MIRRVAHLLQAHLGLGALHTASQQVGQTDDGVHRRADFMTHVGQEGTLGPVGRVGGLPRRLQLRRALGQDQIGLFELAGALGHQLLQVIPVTGQFFLHLLAPGDVLLNAQIVGDVPVRLDDRQDPRKLDPERPVPTPVDELSLPRLTCAQSHPQGPVGFRRRFARLEKAGPLPDHLAKRITGAIQEGTIDVFDAPLQVGDDHARRTLLNGQRQLEQFFRGMPPVARIPPDPGQITASANVQGTIAQLHIQHAAVGPPMAAVEGNRLAADPYIVDLTDDLLRADVGLDVLQTQAGKGFAGISQPAAGRIVELDETQGLRVEQHNAIHRLVNDGAENFLAFAQGLFITTQLGDVPGNAEHADHRTTRLLQGPTGGEEGTHTLHRGHGLDAGTHLAGGHHLPLDAAQRGHLIGGEQHGIVLIQHLFLVFTGDTDSRPVEEKVMPLHILRENRVGRAIGNRIEELKRPQLLALGFFTQAGPLQFVPLHKQHRGTARGKQGKAHRQSNPQDLPARALVHFVGINLGDQRPVGSRHTTTHTDHRHPTVILRLECHPTALRMFSDNHRQRIAPTERNAHSHRRPRQVTQGRDEQQIVSVALEQQGLGSPAGARPALQISEEKAGRVHLQDDRQRRTTCHGFQRRDKIQVHRNIRLPLLPIEVGIRLAPLTEDPPDRVA